MPFNEAPPPKTKKVSQTTAMRARKDLTLSEKIALLDNVKAGDLPDNHQVLAEITGVSRSTISRILQHEDLLREKWSRVRAADGHLAVASPGTKRKRPSGAAGDGVASPDAADVEDALNQWFSDATGRGVCVTGPMVKEKAEQIAREMGHDAFKATDGWVSRWKVRHDIKFRDKKYGGSTKHARKLSAATRRHSLTTSADTSRADGPTRKSKTALSKVVQPIYDIDQTGIRHPGGMDLRSVVDELHKFASTADLAESWDNVGLLVEPTPPHQVKLMMLTNDLTENVVDEAIQKQVQMILSYHPPIFRPLKTLTSANWKERIVVKCIENRVAVFSPHTSYDCVLGGVNDWLLEAFEAKNVQPIKPCLSAKLLGNFTHVVDVSVAENSEIIGNLKTLDNIKVISVKSDSSGRLLKVFCDAKSLVQVVMVLSSHSHASYTTSVLKHEAVPLPGHGYGRKCELESPITLKQAIELVKLHLDLTHVRVAIPNGSSLDMEVSTVATCAGSGASVLRGVPADLYVTGEMSHHEVLDAVHSGTAVILCEHSNTERGFLRKLSDKLSRLLPSVQLLISETDKDPLAVV